MTLHSAQVGFPPASGILQAHDSNNYTRVSRGWCASHKAFSLAIQFWFDAIAQRCPEAVIAAEQRGSMPITSPDPSINSSLSHKKRVYNFEFLLEQISKIPRDKDSAIVAKSGGLK